MKRRRGFTLIEVLVAAAFGTTLLLLTAHVFHTALNGRERLRHTAEDSSALRRAFDVMSRDLHSAVVPPEDAGFQFGLAAEQGTSVVTPFQFATANAEPVLLTRAGNETQLVQYSVDVDPRTGRPMLWRRTVGYPSPNQTSPFDADDAGLVPLLPGVSAITYTFYSTDQQTWVDTWEGETGLPTAVRIDLIIEDRGATARSVPRQESWTFNLPAARFANDEAAAADTAAEAAGTATTGSGATGGQQ